MGELKTHAKRTREHLYIYIRILSGGSFGGWKGTDLRSHSSNSIHLQWAEARGLATSAMTLYNPNGNVLAVLLYVALPKSCAKV